MTTKSTPRVLLLHAWVMPDVPEEDRWGQIDDEWFEVFLAEHR